MSNPHDPFFPFYAADVWAEICGVLGPTDLEMLKLKRTGQTPYDWIRILSETAAKHLDTEPCDRDHCPTNCEPNCHLVPTGAPNAKA